MRDENRDTRLLDAVLHLETGARNFDSLVRISGLPGKKARIALNKLVQEYKRGEHGVELVEKGGEYLFVPKQDLSDQLKDRYGKRNQNLSKAALETMAIVAYSQPVTRMEVEALRGVGADGMIRLLLERGLIKSIGKKDSPGRPVQYGTTREFLKRFDLNSISELPKLDDIDRERFEAHE